MTKSVNLVINSCTECPHFDGRRDYTEDSFETCFRWVCEHDRNKPRDIRRYVDWNDNQKHIPDWCPLIKNTDPIEEHCSHYNPDADSNGNCDRCHKSINKPPKKYNRYSGHYGSQGDQGNE